MRFKLWLMLAVAVVVGGAIAHEALAGGDGKPAVATKPALTASQKAARKRLADTAAFLKKNNLSCGCQHHFAPVTDAAKP
jgi:hypothetical protein